MRLDKNIRHLLIELLKNEVIVSSWGISDIAINKENISFSTNGFLFIGVVNIETIIGCVDSYYVYFNNKFRDKVELVNLISFLDNAIEKTQNYPDTIKACFLKKDS